MEKLTPFAQKVLDFLEPDPIKQQDYLLPTPMAPISQAPAMQTFVERIEQAIEKQEKVMVAGDYDCDGILGTSIMVRALKKRGLETGFYLPDRIREGYGLKEKTVQAAHDKGYSLIITVDNGVKAQPALQKAKELGIDVLVTDHHLIEEEIPALAVIHPDTLEDVYSTLCGAGVAYECARALQAEDGQMLQWAAVASIADCMPVKKQTRALIQKGLEQLNSPVGDLHLKLLAGGGTFDEGTAAYQIVPRINAAGRLANLANVNNVVRYFLANDPGQISDFAGKLSQLNEQRKQMSSAMYALASTKVRLSHPVLLAADDSFHEGIIGLAAGQLCSQYGKPAIVCAHGVDGYKGSMRAPEGFHALHFLEKFEKFSAMGGHAGAAGFSIDEENWEEFTRFVFQEGIAMKWQPEHKQRLEITPKEVTVENLDSLNVLRPFGTGFENPQFEIDHPLVTSVFDLKQGRHRKFTLEGSVSALHFNQSAQDMAHSVLDIQALCGTISSNVYQGRREANFIVDEIIYY